MSAYFTVCYVALSAPVIIAGATLTMSVSA